MGGIANFFMTPLGIVAALSESVATIANNLGFSARAAVYMLQLSCDFLIFPYENAWILVTFSLGMMKMKDFIKWEIVRTILLAIGIAVLFIPWWSVLGIL
jgi:di/tricarboxylate transporter